MSCSSAVMQCRQAPKSMYKCYSRSQEIGEAGTALLYKQAHRRQSSLVRWGQYSRIWGPPSVLKRLTTAFSFAVGLAMSSSSSSPLHGHSLLLRIWNLCLNWCLWLL